CTVDAAGAGRGRVGKSLLPVVGGRVEREQVKALRHAIVSGVMNPEAVNWVEVRAAFPSQVRRRPGGLRTAEAPPVFWLSRPVGGRANEREENTACKSLEAAHRWFLEAGSLTWRPRPAQTKPTAS